MMIMVIIIIIIIRIIIIRISMVVVVTKQVLAVRVTYPQTSSLLPFR